MRFHRICVFFLLLSVLLILSGCDGLTDGYIESDPYPVQSTDTTHSFTDSMTINSESEWNNFVTDAFGSDQSKWPEEVSTINVMMTNGVLISTVIPLSINIEEYQMVDNVVFFEYCSWYQPNSELNITLSDINETSVTDSITVSAGLSMGYDATSISGSISLESSKTVTTSKGISVSTTYDLTEYEQSKLYKVVLCGSYASVRYTFHSLAFVESGATAYGVKVYQDSLTVKLVHD
ncbi:MAG: hypothetical protein JXN62_11035 [Bacteroidales bacterium]|nr:hypothetical protein [Bacteroidales bacterium]